MDAPLVTIFDAAHTGYKTWFFPAFGLIFIAVGSFLVFLPTLSQKLLPNGPQGEARRLFGWAFLCFAIFWTAFSFIVTCGEYCSIQSAISHDQFQTVEGAVTDFIPMPYSGHAMERFKVNGVPFAYSDYVVTNGFNQTSSHGGPIREGLYVRIEYINGKIIKLDIRR